MMISTSLIFGVLGNIISLLVFSSPIKTFWRIVKNKSTGDFSSLPYICTLLSTAQWTYYGFLKPSGGLLIVTINGAGAILQASYVILFIIYAPKKAKQKTLLMFILVDVVFFSAVFLITYFALSHNTSIKVMGVLCVCLTLSMYGSPLAIMRKIVETKSVKYMPFWLSFFLFLNGAVWTVWAVLEKDIYLGIPNGIGFVLGAAQLILYAIYRNGDNGDNLQKVDAEDKRDVEIGNKYLQQKDHVLLDDDKVKVVVTGDIKGQRLRHSLTY